MLAAPMPPQASHRSYQPLPSSPVDAGAAASHTIMTPAIPPQPSSHPSTASSPNMPCGLTSNAPTSHPSSLARPKLTLQTSSLPRTFGSSSTGLSLSLAAGPTASPTIRNTFKNAYDVTSPFPATASPSRSNTSRFAKPSSPYTSHNPYQLPLGVKSILRNSPLESTRRRSNSVAPGGSNGGSSTRRVFFPTKKQVSYRFPLEEEIKTVRYTARHSDLVSEPQPEIREASSDEDSDGSTSSLVSSDTTTSDEDPDSAPPSSSDSTPEKKRKKRKYRSAERQVRAVALMDGLERDTCTYVTPQTPRQGRAKRRCEWRWTLGPLDKTGELSTKSPQPDNPTIPPLVLSKVPQFKPQLETPVNGRGSSTSATESTVVPPSDPSKMPTISTSQSSDTPSNESTRRTSPESDHGDPDPPE